MTDLVMRLIAGWYDPDSQVERDSRTRAAHAKAISVRIKAERVGTKVDRTRASYERAQARLNR